MSTTTSPFLQIGENKKKATEINYEDLVILYKQFIETYGRVPSTNDGKAKYNMPQQRIIKRVLESSGISYNDFINQFGKYNHVRSSIDNYDTYIDIFKRKAKELGRPLLSSELINNSYGLPSAQWLIKNCPDIKVKTYNDFVIWCGLKPNKIIHTKESISEQLLELEKELDRPITTTDITQSNVGFSMIVINRLWGSLSKCKEDIGLMKTKPVQPRPFSYYKENLLETLNYLRNNLNRNIISWKDIEGYSNSANHKAYLKSFNREGIDIFAFIKDQGFLMNPSDFSFHYTFDNGERVVSTLEYDFSNYLNATGYQYKKDYIRDTMYKSFIPSLSKTRINCDYYINNKVVEIAGMISNQNNNWYNKKYPSKQENDYKEKLKYKQNLLEENNIPYLFLFPEDFVSDEYKKKFIDFI